MATQPVPDPEKPRLLRQGRGVAFAVAPLVLILLVLVGCSVRQPGRPEPAPPPPTIDAAAVLRADAAAMLFPIRVPRLPADWRATSAKRDGITKGRAVPPPGDGLEDAVISKIDYIAPGGWRITLVQSDADKEHLIEYLDSASTFEQALHESAEQEVDGVTWWEYTGYANQLPVWTTQLSGPSGPAQIAIRGTAGVAEYRTLAAAIQTQSPLPVR